MKLIFLHLELQILAIVGNLLLLNVFADSETSNSAELTGLIARLKSITVASQQPVGSLSSEIWHRISDSTSSQLPQQSNFQPSLIQSNEFENDLASGSPDYSDIDLPEPKKLTHDVSTNTEENEVNLTRMHEEAIEFRKAQIKEAIMNKLRLDRLPTGNSPMVMHRFPQHLLDISQMQMDIPPPVDNYHAKVKSMIRFPQPVPSVKAAHIPSDLVRDTIFIPLPLTVSSETIEKATLLVYLDIPSSAYGQEVRLLVRTNRDTKNRIIYSERVRLSHRKRWHHIDVTDECKAWLRNEWSYNLGLVASAELNGVNLIKYQSNQTINDDTMDRIPLIKLELNDFDPRRNRREFNNLQLSCEPEDNEARCCRYNFVLDFGELGSDFDFIISPKRYYANYCAGECPKYLLPSNMPMVGRRQVQRCCTPKDVVSLQLIYRDNDNGIMQSELPGMSINSCSCE